MKKIAFFLLTLCLTAGALKAVGGTVLKGGDNYEIFYETDDGGLRAEKPSLNELRYGLSFEKKKAESCSMSEKNAEKLLEKLKATEVTRESGENFRNVYYYSPFISDFVLVSGKKANLHVSFFPSGENVKIATPINFGGY